MSDQFDLFCINTVRFPPVGAVQRASGGLYGARLIPYHDDVVVLLEKAQILLMVIGFVGTFFAQDVSGFMQALSATHSPLAKRILRIDPHWGGKFAASDKHDKTVSPREGEWSATCANEACF